MQPLTGACCSWQTCKAAACRVFEEPWWDCHLATADCGFWAAAISKPKMARVSLRARAGALNALEDFVKHLGRKLQPFLPLAFVLLLRMLSSVVEAEQVGFWGSGLR